MSNPVRFSSGQKQKSSQHYGRKWYTKPVAGGRKKHSSNVVQEDYAKITHFLKTKAGPQLTITIAKFCGYATSNLINPTLYEMQKKHLLQKTNEGKPMWSLSPSAIDVSGNVSSPSRSQLHTDYTNQQLELTLQKARCSNNSQHHSRAGVSNINSNRGKQNMHRKRKHNIAEKSNNVSVNRGNASPSSKSLLHAANLSSSEFSVYPQVRHEILFRRTINDKSAPGAYNTEQSHERRMETYDSHRKNSPNYLNAMASEQPLILHKNTESHVIPSHVDMTEYHEDNRTVSVPTSYRLEETNMSLHVDNSTNYYNMGDDSEYTDDDDYDLNYRISDVVSLRDPDFRDDDQVLKSGMLNFSDSEITGVKEQDVDTSNTKVDSEEVWVDNGYLALSNTWESQTNNNVAQKIIDLTQILHNLYGLPFKMTTKDILASKLNMAKEDLQKLLDDCLQKEWIDYSVFNHVRLTDTGVNHLLQLQQSRNDGGPPPYPDQLLQNSSTFNDRHCLPWSDRQKNLMKYYNLNNTPQCSSSRIQNHPQGQNNNSDCIMSAQGTSVQAIVPKERNLTPWLSLRTEKLSSERVNNSLESANTIGSLSTPSSLLAGTSSSLPTKATSSSFGKHLLRDNKTSNSVTEDPAAFDISNQRTSLSCASFISRQEQLSPKRPALLSTPDIRGSNKFVPAVGKAALLPFPGHQLHQQFQPMQQETPTNLQISAESFAVLNKNPISAFMEYGQCRHTPARIEVLNQRGPSHKPVFTIAAVLGSRVFPGISSSNKKDGKKDAAEQAIRILIAEGQYNMSANSSVMSIPESSMTQFDKIAALTHHKFNQLIAVIPESLVGRKVIAGLVMKMNEADTGTVVAVGSGNRCITGDKLSLRGLTINDCHAEIITRRGFMRFLYYQLRSYDFKKEHPLFEKSGTGKLRIKPSITFHLYISTAPCGDGALFSPRDVESNNVTLTNSCTSHRPTFETNVQGVLRTKMEGGEGTIPVDAEKPVQTWDGIVRGERLRTMSCSDKICRWNVVGLQGALLANFLDPVYLNSITLGFLFDAGHLSRAVCCRLNRGEPPLDKYLHFPYRLNHPVLGRVTACDATRETQKTKSYSINWMVEDEKPEIVDGCQGIRYTVEKTEQSQTSRLCKKNMFDCFHQTCQTLGRQDCLKAQTYSKAKRLNDKFVKAKEAMIDKFKNTNCGIWLSKPLEEKMFS